MTNRIAVIVLSMLVVCCVIFGAVFWFLGLLTDKRFQYFRDRKIPHVRQSVIAHFFAKLLTRKENYGEKILSLYKSFDRKKYVGFYALNSHQILIRDITMVKNVLIDDFSYFQDRTSSALASGLEGGMPSDTFALTAEDWKIMRHLLSGYLASKPFLERCFERCTRASEQLCANIERLAAREPEVDALRPLAEYAASTTAHAVLGGEVERASSRLGGGGGGGEVRFHRDYRWMRSIGRRLRAAPGPPDDLVGFLRRYRGLRVGYDRPSGSIVLGERAGEQGGSLHVTEEAITAQAYVACLAGFEGSRSVIASALLEIARHPDVQERIHEEIVECGGGGRLLEMEYLDAVLNEVLRLHPPVGAVARRCVRGYRFEGDRLRLERGDRVVVSVRALHTDPRLWPDPHLFDPERFGPEDERAPRHPCAFMPFGRGPRHCIGIRFAKLQYLTALFHLLRRFRVEATAACLHTAATCDAWDQPTHCRVRFYRRCLGGGGGGNGSDPRDATKESF